MFILTNKAHEKIQLPLQKIPGYAHNAVGQYRIVVGYVKLASVQFFQLQLV